MSETEPTVQQTPPPGPLATLGDLFFAPSDAFRGILRRPTLLLPIAALVALSVAFTLVWTRKVEPQEFFRTQMRQSGQWEQIPADRRGAVLEQQARFFPYMAWGGVFVGTALLLLVVAGVYLFVFNFFYAAEVGFAQSLSITAWTFLAVGLVQTPLTLLVMALRDDWNVNPQEALHANLGLLLERGEVAAPLWALATSLDLFSFWYLFLLATAYGVVARRSAGSAAVGVLTPWALVVLLKVGSAAVFGG